MRPFFPPGELITVQDAKTILENAGISELSTRLIKRGSSIEIPIEMVFFLYNLRWVSDAIEESRARYTHDTPTSNGVASISVPSDEIWEILDLLMLRHNDAGVANRTTLLKIVPPAPATYTSATEEFKSTAITTTASQELLVHFPKGQTGHFKNVNGTIGYVANENPTNKFLLPATSIVTEQTNQQAGDLTGLKLLYRKVGTV